MARKNLIRSSTHAYHIFNRVNNREHFKLPDPVVWDLFIEELWRMVVTRGLKIHAFVLMPNHYHLLASPGEDDLGFLMSDWSAALTKAYNQLGGRTGHLFNGRYGWSLIDSPLYFAYALKYIYRNPLKAKLAQSGREYPFSTLSGILGETPLSLPIEWPIMPEDRLFLPEEPYDLEDWINDPFSNEEDNQVQKALRRKVVRFSNRVHKKLDWRMILPKRTPATFRQFLSKSSRTPLG